MDEQELITVVVDMDEKGNLIKKEVTEEELMEMIDEAIVNSNC